MQEDLKAERPRSDGSQGRLRIGIFALRVAKPRGNEDNVSGHVQIPLKTASLLQERGDNVEIITTRKDPHYTFPKWMPRDVPVHFVIPAREETIRKEAGEDLPPRAVLGRLSLIKQLRQIWDIARVSSKQKLDVVHCFGAAGTGHVASLLALLRPRLMVVLTLTRGDLRVLANPFIRKLWKRLALIVTATEHVRTECHRAGLEVGLLRHGLLNVAPEGAKRRRHRVLFWRDLTANNGADICLVVFEQLARRFPEVSFDIAVRPSGTPTEGAESLARRFTNVTFHQYPYATGVSIATLLRESLCVFLPFRRLSIQPQFAVLESMASGAVVVASNVESNCELLKHGKRGYVFDPDRPDDAVALIGAVLKDRAVCTQLGAEGARYVTQYWEWTQYIESLVRLYDLALAARMGSTRKAQS